MLSLTPRPLPRPDAIINAQREAAGVLRPYVPEQQKPGQSRRNRATVPGPTSGHIGNVQRLSQQTGKLLTKHRITKVIAKGEASGAGKSENS
jgi:hypothetical protein